VKGSQGAFQPLAICHPRQGVLARKVLALTKMNWDNTQFDGAEPVTLRASRHCFRDFEEDELIVRLIVAGN
jgi:hypothetical protein